MINDEKADPGVFVELLGKRRKIEYNMRSAKLFKRLTGGKSLFNRMDFSDFDQLVAFFVAGLRKHSPDLVGDVDASGRPDSLTEQTIERIENLDLDIKAIDKLLLTFIRAYTHSQPATSDSSGDTSQKKEIPSESVNETGIS